MVFSDSVTYIYQTVANITQHVQAEILVFFIAIVAHAVLFGPFARRLNIIRPKAKEGKESPRGASPRTSLAPKPTTEQRERAPSAQQQASVVKKLGAEKRLDEAFEVIRKSRGSDKAANYLFNALIDGCVENGDLTGAERVLTEADAAGAADVVTYNTVLKLRLSSGSGSLQKGQQTLRQMRGKGVQPTCVTFNQLIDATIQTNLPATWRLIDEMAACGVKPNHITASILLKSVQPGARAGEIERTMAVVDSMEDSMDDVLISSTVEACVRADRCDLMAKVLKKLGTIQNLKLGSATTYGSVIRAYGVLGDVKSAWSVWKRMSANGIAPTSITLGCMVEAFVGNGDIVAGHNLIRTIAEDAATRHLVNAVIYCSILKGFSHVKDFNNTWDVYKEILTQGLSPTVSVFNALLDACARCGKMNKVSTVLEDMSRYNMEPNLVTYSSIIKGYCLDKQLDRALELLEHMKNTKGFCPDEVTWNTLLDGCARQGLYDRGRSLLGDMMESGVAPSNFTLSVLVKLVYRKASSTADCSKRLDETFELCDSLAQKHRFKLNTFVFNNLVQACIVGRDLPRAMATFERMLREKCRPDSRTYTLLIQGFSSNGKAPHAGRIVAATLGLEELATPGLLSSFGAAALQPKGGLPAEPLSELLDVLATRSGPGGDKDMAVKLFGECRKVRGLRLDSAVSTKLASEAMRRGR